MRTYKTWEIIKMLSENPNLRFKAMPYSEAKTFFDEACLVDGVLCWEGNNAYPLQIAIGKYDIDWQLVEIPVTWQEALQALIDGKRVKCICDVDFCDFNDNCCYFSLNHPDMCIHGLKHGQWFIVPEGVDE